MDDFAIKKFQKGGGVSAKSTWLGGEPKVHVRSTRGEGGSKSPENWSTWFMNDPLVKIQQIILRLVLKIMIFELL